MCYCDCNSIDHTVDCGCFKNRKESIALRQWCQLYQDVPLTEYDFVFGGQNLDMTEKFGSHLLSTTMDRMNWLVKKKSYPFHIRYKWGHPDFCINKLYHWAMVCNKLYLLLINLTTLCQHSVSKRYIFGKAIFPVVLGLFSPNDNIALLLVSQSKPNWRVTGPLDTSGVKNRRKSFWLDLWSC